MISMLYRLPERMSIYNSVADDSCVGLEGKKALLYYRRHSSGIDAATELQQLRDEGYGSNVLDIIEASGPGECLPPRRRRDDLFGFFCGR